MKVIFLGTNGWYDTETGNTVCILVQTAEYDIILDAGNGLYKADRYIGNDKPVYLFLSHFHLDHITGLHILAKFRFRKGLKIFGPEGTRRTLAVLVNQPFTMPLAKLPYPVDVVELLDEKAKIPFSLESAPLLHTDLTLGYRLGIDGKVVAYCPDTGYCENAVKLAQNADLLITECSYRTGETDPDWPHLNPESAARIAREADAKKLALVHFDASRYQTIESREDAAKHARMIFTDTCASVDGQAISL